DYDGGPPYALARLDTLRDQRASLRRENDTDVLTLKAAEEALKRAEVALTDAQKTRREARDAAESTTNETQRDDSTQRLRLAQLDERIAEQRLQAARTQRQLAKMD